MRSCLKESAINLEFAVVLCIAGNVHNLDANKIKFVAISGKSSRKSVSFLNVNFLNSVCARAYLYAPGTVVPPAYKCKGPTTPREKRTTRIVSREDCVAAHRQFRGYIAGAITVEK